MLDRRQRAVHAFITALWLVVNVQFWSWWASHAAVGRSLLATAVTLALAYQTFILPTMFWYFVGRMRRPVPRSAPPGLRVAVATLCVPASESVDVIERQLVALGGITYAHDAWILDEGASLEVRRLADRHGVRYFTRSGVPRWNQEGPPFQRATKAGNVNAWLQHLEERGFDYDAFVQLDLDHHPVPEYLDRVLGHLEDPSVGWVQAPSVVGNLRNWTARGLAEQDLVLQGPLQMGFFGASSTPFIIGSHTTYRMKAVREIGGFQPTRAEDHLDTILLAAHGYRGVYVPEVIATGDGPDDFATYLRQQFAWAHSMITVLFTWTPRLLHRYRPAQAVQFLFAQTWYLFWSLSLLTLWSAPLVAQVSDSRIADTSLTDYLVYFVPVALVGWVMWCAARPHFQPRAIGITWRSAVLTVARWPVVLWALASVVLRVRYPYMVTPKRGDDQALMPRSRGAVVYGPLIGLAAAGLLATVPDILDHEPARPYLALVLLNTAVPLAALAVTVLLEVHHTSRAAAAAGLSAPWRLAITRRGGVVLSLALLTGATLASTILGWDQLTRGIS